MDYSKEVIMIKYNPEPIKEIPKVKILDENGKIVGDGYYFWYPKSCPYPVSDGVQEVKAVEGIVTYEQGDWGLPNTLKLKQVMEPHKIVLHEKKAIDTKKVLETLEKARQRIVETREFYDCDFDDDYPKLILEIDSTISHLKEECCESN